jgi:hypothetical protein
MKFQILLATCLAVYCSGELTDEEREKIEEHLPHFDLDEFTDDFVNYDVVPDTCSDISKSCVESGHDQARRCITMFYDEKGSQIAECKAQMETDENGETKHDKWQKMSFEYHKNIQSCLAGEDPPVLTDEEIFRIFKRDTEDESESDENGCPAEIDFSTEGFDNGKACFDAFKANKVKCAKCVAQDEGCADYAACTGRGRTAPSNDRLAGWKRAQSKLARQKRKAIKEAKKELFLCIGMSPDGSRVRRHHARKHWNF